MESIKEQIENKCKHFNGVQHIKCKAGVEYESIRDMSTIPPKLPCLFDSGARPTCDKVCKLSPEEVEKGVKEFKELEHSIFGTFRAVKDHIAKTGKQKGKMECPSCGGDLEYAVSSYNGHLRARCACGVSFMQ
jgi:hypothetical protein